MGARALLRLAATRLGGACANANAPSQITAQSTQRLYAHASGAARGTARDLPISRLGLATIYRRNEAFFSHTARQLSSSANEGAHPRRFVKRLLPRWTYYFGFGLVLFAVVTCYNDNDRTSRCVLNRELFTPCLVVSNEPLSPTAFILTVKTPSSRRIFSGDTPTNQAVVREAWRHGLWSVEIKQPQLQIARNYTPLPPIPGDEEQRLEQRPSAVPNDDDAAQLRFLVRRYDGGETSTYLSRLRSGDSVELRGPHLGFDVPRRLGPAGRDVVFLAGGTGVAPALQAAARLLDGESDVSVRILWANRSAADCAGCARAAQAMRRSGWLWGRRGGTTDPAVGEEPSVIVRQLRALQTAYEAKGRTLEMKCAIDEEGGVFGAQDITDAVGRSKRLATHSSSSCYFHNQEQLVYSTDENDALISKPGGEKISAEGQCACVGGVGGGKNLFMISGPDGFVNAYVGPKIWADGAERQGPLGGLIAELMRKGPGAWEDWLILKQ